MPFTQSDKDAGLLEYLAGEINKGTHLTWGEKSVSAHVRQLREIAGRIRDNGTGDNISNEAKPR